MGFIENDGNIILDVVLTDAGRRRLAKGDGSFKITKFALSDDEIDYGEYNKNHPSGSAYFDLEILQTPVLEAFTDNAASIKSKLISIPRNNLKFLPILKLNRQDSATDFHSSNSFLVAVDKDTEDNVALTTSGHTTGIQFGQKLDPAGYIQIEQGLDTTEISAANNLGPELVETQYSVEIDSRFGRIVSVQNQQFATPANTDDDGISTYLFSLSTTPNFVVNNWSGKKSENSSNLVIRGPRGTRFNFMIASSLELVTGTYLFEQLGSTATIESVNCYYIDSIVRVSGLTTGYSIDIPVRFIKKV